MTIKDSEIQAEIRRCALQTPVTLTLSQVLWALDQIEDLQAQLKDRDTAIEDLEKELRGLDR